MERQVIRDTIASPGRGANGLLQALVQRNNNEWLWVKMIPCDDQRGTLSSCAMPVRCFHALFEQRINANRLYLTCHFLD